MIFRKLWSKIDNYFSKDEQLIINSLENEKKEHQEQNLLLQEQNDTLNKVLSLQEAETELEKFWNNKRPQTSWRHKARPLFEKTEGTWDKVNINVDPRIFFTNDNTLSTFQTVSFDERASKCLNWVASNITYTPDKEGEFWQFAYETQKRKLGDCEDGAILMANMMLMSGIPYWRIRLNCGEVQGGGHAYVTYLRELDNEWYVMD